MNTDQIHGYWREMKGWAIEHWGRATGDPWLKIAGMREQNLGRYEASLARSRHLAETDFPHIRHTPARAMPARRQAAR